MFKLKIFISILIFSFLLIVTSIVKNQTRKIEKEISFYKKIILHKEKDLNETQLDFFYLTSPKIIENKMTLLSDKEYYPMEYSRIFLNLSNFLNIENKYVINGNQNEKTQKK